MKLYFKKYEDDYNSQEWAERMLYLEQLTEDLKKQDIKSFTNEKLLDTIEDVNELINYYISYDNIPKLEKVVEIQKMLIKAGFAGGLKHIGLNLMIINLKRADAYLYDKNGNTLLLMEYYEIIVEDICEYVKVIKDSGLNDDEKAFILWNCAYIMHQAIISGQDSGNNEMVLDLCNKNIEILEELEKHTENPVLKDRTADFYSLYGQLFYSCGDIESGRLFNENALELLSDISGRTFKDIYLSDYFVSRILWTKALYYSEMLTYEDDEKPLFRLAEQIKTFHPENKNVSMIMTAVSGLVKYNTGLYFQQNDDIENGLSYIQEAAEELENAFGYFDDNTECSKNFFTEALCVKIYCTLPVLYFSLGTLFSALEDADEAEKAFLRSLQITGNQKKYKLSSPSASIISALCSRFLGYIYQSYDETDKAEFYYKQALSMSEKQENSQPVQALTIKIEVCTLLSAMYLDAKNKKQASEYSRKGLDACNSLMKISSEAVQPDVREMLEKINKKSNRKFGIF